MIRQSFADVVRERLGDQATPDMLAFAAALEKNADPDGYLRTRAALVAEEAGLPKDVDPRSLASDLRSVGLITPPESGAVPRLVWPETADERLTDQEQAEILAEVYGDADGEDSGPPPRADHERPVDAAPGPELTDWAWNVTDPIGSAEYWARQIIRCRQLNNGAKVFAWLLRETADTRDGTVYLSAAKIAEEFRRSRSLAESKRAELRDTGWITESGVSRYNLKVWRLSVPDCSCGEHG